MCVYVRVCVCVYLEDLKILFQFLSLILYCLGFLFIIFWISFCDIYSFRNWCFLSDLQICWHSFIFSFFLSPAFVALFFFLPKIVHLCLLFFFCQSSQWFVNFISPQRGLLLCWSPLLFFFFLKDQSFFFLMYLFIYLAALGLRCCTRAFSSCGKRGLIFIAVHRPLIAVGSAA